MPSISDSQGKERERERELPRQDPNRPGVVQILMNQRKQRSKLPEPERALDPSIRANEQNRCHHAYKHRSTIVVTCSASSSSHEAIWYSHGSEWKVVVCKKHNVLQTIGLKRAMQGATSNSLASLLPLRPVPSLGASLHFSLTNTSSSPRHLPTSKLSS